MTGSPALSQIFVTPTAIRNYRRCHGPQTGRLDDGDVAREVLALLAEMYARDATVTESTRGYYRHSMAGYTLVLSPDQTTITGYTTALHKERTWFEVRAGVPPKPDTPDSSSSQRTSP